MRLARDMVSPLSMTSLPEWQKTKHKSLQQSMTYILIFADEM